MYSPEKPTVSTTTPTPKGFLSQKLCGFILLALLAWAALSGLGLGSLAPKALAEWGPCGGYTAGGARSLNHRLVLLFLRYGTLDLAEGEGRTVCVWGSSKGL